MAKKDLVSYSILAMPLAFAGIPLYIHAPDFYATTHGVSLLTLGVALLIMRFIDAIQDPLIGYFSDQYAKQRPTIMMAAALLLVCSFAMLFAPLIDFYIVWFILFIFLSTTAFSVLTINLNTLGGLWSKDKNEKTTIAGYREVFSLAGLMLAAILPSILQNYMGKERAFAYISIVLFILMLCASILFMRWQRKHLKINIQSAPAIGFNFKEGALYTSPYGSSDETARAIDQHIPVLDGLLSNKGKYIKLLPKQITHLPKQIQKFFMVYGVSMLASSIPAVLILFFIRDLLHLERYTGLFLCTYFLSGAVGIILCNYISPKIGKHHTWAIAMSLAIVSFIWAYFLKAGDFWAYLLICGMSGIAFGGELVLPSSILADHIQQTNNERNAAFQFGVLAFLAKIALSLAAAITFPYLQSVGFKAGQESSETALHALSLSYASIPCFIKLISIYLLWRIINEKNDSSTRSSRSHDDD